MLSSTFHHPSTRLNHRLFLLLNRAYIFLRGGTVNGVKMSYTMERPIVINLDAAQILPKFCTIECDYSGNGEMIWNKFLEGRKKFHAPITKAKRNSNVSEKNSINSLRCEVPYGLAVRNFLAENPNQIPAEWKGLTVVFIGTILRFGQELAHPALDCFKDGECFTSRSSLFISTCVGIGRLLR